MSEQKPEESDAALQARLSKLGEALQAQDQRRAAETAPKAAASGGPFGRAMSAGLNVFSEFVAAILVGAAIGWLGDYWLGTKPWLLIVFVGFGTAAGFWNIYRLGARQARAGGNDEPPSGGIV